MRKTSWLEISNGDYIYVTHTQEFEDEKNKIIIKKRVYTPLVVNIWTYPAKPKPWKDDREFVHAGDNEGYSLSIELARWKNFDKEKRDNYHYYINGFYEEDHCPVYLVNPGDNSSYHQYYDGFMGSPIVYINEEDAIQECEEINNDYFEQYLNYITSVFEEPLSVTEARPNYRWKSHRR